MQDAVHTGIVNGLVVLLNAHADSIFQRTVCGLLGSLVKTLQSALGEIVLSALGNNTACNGAGQKEEVGLHGDVGLRWECSKKKMYYLIRVCCSVVVQVQYWSAFDKNKDWIWNKLSV